MNTPNPLRWEHWTDASAQLRRAFAEGADAFERGGLSSNPHPRGSLQHRAWQAGYQNAALSEPF